MVLLEEAAVVTGWQCWHDDRNWCGVIGKKKEVPNGTGELVSVSSILILPFCSADDSKHFESGSSRNMFPRRSLLPVLVWLNSPTCREQLPETPCRPRTL